MQNLLRPTLGPTLQQGLQKRPCSPPCRLWRNKSGFPPPSGASGLTSLRDSARSRQSVHCKAAAVTAAAVKPCCKAAAAAATAVAATSLPEAVLVTIMASMAYTALCFVAMTLFPRKSASVFSSVWPFIPLSLAYMALLVASWSPDTLSIMMPGSLQDGLSGGFKPQFFPRLEGISALFGRLGVSASFLLHVLVINLFAGRWCLLEGLRQGIPTAHSVLACTVFGPLGLLSHHLTLALSKVFPVLKEVEQTVTLKSENGSITILPYTESTSSA